MLASFLAATLAAGGLTAPVEMELSGRELRAGDFATGVPSDIVIARVPHGIRMLHLGEDARRRLISSRFPGVPFQLRARGPLVLRLSGQTGGKKARCLRAVRAIAPGEAIVAADAEKVDCPADGSRASLRIDRTTGSVLASAPIMAGEHLGPIRLPGQAQVSAGAQMRFRTVSGPVSIEREVVTLQTGRVGRPVFVRTADGQVIAAPLLGVAIRERP